VTDLDLEPGSRTRWLDPLVRAEQLQTEGRRLEQRLGRHFDEMLDAARI
jgi:hypothetical protein